MTTTTRARKDKIRGSKTISHNPPPAPSKEEPAELVGLAALLAADLPRRFESPADVDAHIRALRDEWDD